MPGHTRMRERCSFPFTKKNSQTFVYFNWKHTQQITYFWSRWICRIESKIECIHDGRKMFYVCVYTHIYLHMVTYGHIRFVDGFCVSVCRFSRHVSGPCVYGKIYWLRRPQITGRLGIKWNVSNVTKDELEKAPVSWNIWHGVFMQLVKQKLKMRCNERRHDITHDMYRVQKTHPRATIRYDTQTINMRTMKFHTHLPIICHICIFIFSHYYVYFVVRISQHRIAEFH